MTQLGRQRPVAGPTVAPMRVFISSLFATNGARRAWLLAGVLVGCLMGAAQILHDLRMPVRLLDGVAARVNGREIDSSSIERTVAGSDAALRATGAAAGNRVLARMIDEELLVQQALDSGAAQTDPEVRAALVRAAINRVNTETAALPVTRGDVEAYFAAHRTAYATATRYEVTPLYFEAGQFPKLSAARQRAEAAREGFRAGQPVELLARAADTLPFVPPGELATAGTLVNYFGSTVVNSIGEVRIGGSTPPIDFGRGVLVVYVSRRIDGEIPALESIESLVAADLLREQQETALARLLDSLHKAAHIDVAPAYRVASDH
jgi:hypothetical protein